MPYDEAGWEHWKLSVMAHRVRVAQATTGTDPRAMAAQRGNLALCRSNTADALLYFLCTFGWIFEPRNPPGFKKIPFIPTPRQVELIDLLCDDVKKHAIPDWDAILAIVKSRDVGGTWIDVADTAKDWLFVDYYTMVAISADWDLSANHKLPKSYFFKLFFLLSNLPPWFMPEGFTGFVRRSEHAKEGYLHNPATEGTVTGATNTPDTERGNRLDKITMDEPGTYENFKEIHANATQMARVLVIVGSAHTGHGYDWYNLVHGREGYEKVRQFVFWWWQVPGHDERWLADMKRILPEELFLREVLIQWLAGAGDFMYAAAQSISPGHFPFKPGWPIFVSIDDGYDDHFAISWWQRDVVRRRWRCIAGYYNHGQPLDYYGHLLTGHPHHKYFWGEDERALMAWLREHQIYNATYYGDRHGDNTELIAGKSPFQALADDFNIVVVTNKVPEDNDLKYRRDAVLNELGNMDFDEHHGAPMVLESLQFSRFPNRKGNTQLTSEAKDAPHIQKPSHFRTTVEYLFINEKNEWIVERADRRGPLPRSTANRTAPKPTSRRWRTRPEDGIAVPLSPRSTVSGWVEAEPWSLPR